MFAGFGTLVVKHLTESRWLLGCSALILFALSWTTIYGISGEERRLRELSELSRELAEKTKAAEVSVSENPATEEGDGQAGEEEEEEAFIDPVPSDDEIVAKFGRENARDYRRTADRVRARGGMFFIPSMQLIVRFWEFPGFLIPVLLWGIARGSIAVAGEIERGTLDLVLSRPISRMEYLLTQVTATVIGFAVLAAAMTFGNYFAARYHGLNVPPELLPLIRGTSNLAALGFSVYGVSLWFSSMDLVRWRPNLLAAGFCLISSINLMLARLESLEWLKPFLENTSVFKAYEPADAIGAAENFAVHMTALGLVGAAGIALAGFFFHGRDLPSNS